MNDFLKKLNFYYKEFIYRNIGGKRVLYWFLLTYFIYGVLLLVVIPELMSFSGGKPVFNVLPFGYNVEYANSLLFALGEEGRRAYLYHLIPIDLFFPFLFAYSNAILTGYLLNRLQRLNSKIIYLCLIPVFASWFDYLENLGVMAMLLKYPNETELLVQFSDFFSVAKSLLITIYFAVLFALFFLFFRRKKSFVDKPEVGF